jgi:membrane-associated protease RseP (regulator of RpoE activity)
MSYERPNIDDIQPDHDAVSRALGGLRKVDAPGDFESRVRAGIARRVAEPRQPFFFRYGLLYVVPTVLALVVGTTYFLTADRETNSAAVTQPPIVVQPAADTSVAAPAPENSQFGTTSVAPPQPPPVADNASTVRPPAPKVGTRGERRVVSNGGSVDRALRTSSTPILPKGLQTEPQKEELGDFQTTVELSASDLLRAIGIEPDGAMHVRSVTPNSPAAKAGVRTGDVLDSVDGKPVTSDTVFRGTIELKKLGVTRDGRRIELTLKN